MNGRALGRALVLAGVLVAVPSARAATHTWTGAVNGSWSDPGNWSGGAPAAGEPTLVLVFPQAASNKTNSNDVAGLFVDSISFTGGGYTISGLAISLASGITVDPSVTQFIYFLPSIALVASQTFSGSTSSSYPFELDGVISGPPVAALTIGGFVGFTAANTYQGPTTILSGGTAYLQINGRLGDASAGTTVAGNGRIDLFLVSNLLEPVTLQAGALLFAFQQSTVSGPLTIAGDATLATNPGGLLTLAGPVSGAGVATFGGEKLIVNTAVPGGVSLALGVVGGIGPLGSLSCLGNFPGAVSPGSSPGILRVDGNVSLAPNVRTHVELNGPAAGAGYDRLDVGGNVALAGPLEVSEGFVPSIGSTFIIVQATGTISGTFAGLPNGAVFSVSGQQVQIGYSPHTVTLTVLSAATPVASLGSEFRVNSYTTSAQVLPAASMDAAGGFVVAWSSFGQDGSSAGIFAQRYDGEGVPEGAEFQVNTVTTNGQDYPAVASADAGAFVVVWTGPDATGYRDIKARRYRNDGIALDYPNEFRVNTYTSYHQTTPSVASDSAGNFVVVWSSNQYGQYQAPGIFGQRFTSAGTSLGGEFRVNTLTFVPSFTPKVARSATGDFVVVWNTGTSILGRRFGSSGAPLGVEFGANAGGFVTSNPGVAMSGSGSFIVTWRSDGQDGASGGVYARRFDSSGTTIGGEFRVNAYTTGDQVPAVAMDGAGEFVVAYSSDGQDGSLTGVFLTAFDSNGCVLSSDFRVNTYTTDRQEQVAVARTRSAASPFVVAWGSVAQDGSLFGVYAQRMEQVKAACGVPTAAVSLDGSGTVPCPGAATTVRADLTGTPAWTLSWSDGVVETNVLTSPHIRAVTPTVNTTYTVTSVQDGIQTGMASGSAMVTIASDTSAPTVTAPAAATTKQTLCN